MHSEYPPRHRHASWKGVRLNQSDLMQCSSKFLSEITERPSRDLILASAGGGDAAALKILSLSTLSLLTGDRGKEEEERERLPLCCSSVLSSSYFWTCAAKK
jgi:hypothetical protein